MSPYESSNVPEKIGSIDWRCWQPVDRATLLFVIRDGHILLIRKKRGLGAGKINGPGGRLHDGETPLEAAVREVEEELRVTPTEPSWCGEHRFQFVDGYSLHVDVFTASDCVGEPEETEEARPLWTPTHAIPYEEMWEDDRLWVPLMLSGQHFSGKYIFDGDTMLDHEVVVI
jgi:8-oxo-dGTP diphosphatase